MTKMYDEEGQEFDMEEEIQKLTNKFCENIDKIKGCPKAEALYSDVLPAYELSLDVLMLLDICVKKISELDDEVKLLKGIHKDEMKNEMINNIMKGSQ